MKISLRRRSLESARVERQVQARQDAVSSQRLALGRFHESVESRDYGRPGRFARTHDVVSQLFYEGKVVDQEKTHVRNRMLFTRDYG